MLHDTGSTFIPRSYRAVHLAARPDSHIGPETFITRTHDTSTLPVLRHGQVLLQPKYFSIDPSMRNWLNEKRTSSISGVDIGDMMYGQSVGQVLASEDAAYSPGDIVVTFSPWSELSVLDCRDPKNRIEKIDGKYLDDEELADHLGILGITGLTAYFGMLEIARLRKGDFVIISGAAGAVGSVAGQIAKIHGATVLGIAGSEEKCNWLVNELGFDAALNYKSDEFIHQFKTKQRIDVFYDNVGGSILDLALTRAQDHARFVICGGTSQYNASKDGKQGLQNYLVLVPKRIRMEGFVCFGFEDQFDKARDGMRRWMDEGKLKATKTILKGGIEMLPEALRGIYEGINTGKLIVKLEQQPVSKL